MAVFTYKALNGSGSSVSGKVEADHEKDARAKLRVQDVFVTEINIVAGQSKSSVVLTLPRFGSVRKLNEVAGFTRQLSILIESGIPLADSLAALVEQSETQEWKQLITSVREKIVQGSSFAEALAAHPRHFNSLYVNMVRAGEASGNLDKVLSRLGEYIHSQAKLRGKVSAAMIYPAIMLTVGSGVVFFLFIFVIPKILAILEKQKIPKPLPTQILMYVTQFITQFWWLILIVVALCFVMTKLFAATHKGKFFIDRMKLNIPVIGQLYRKQAISRFASTFGTLLESGIPAMEALAIVKSVVDNLVMEKVIEEVRMKIMEGADISTPLKKGNIFPPVVSYMIAIGEQSGNLEKILQRISKEYDEEIDLTTQKITALLEPVIIVIMAIVVGFVAISILLPIVNISGVK